MSNCCLLSCFGICRRRKFSPGDAPIDLQDPAFSANNPIVPPSQVRSLSVDLNIYQYGRREMWGDLRQRWIDDADEPNCTVQAPDFEYRSLTRAKPRSKRWKVDFDHWAARPPALQDDLERCGLPVGNEDYHDVKISKRSTIEHPIRKHGTNFHHFSTAIGVIIVRNVERYDGPWWSQVALAQYDIHFARTTLRHIYLENVVNADTKDFIQTIWAKTQPPNSREFLLSPASVKQVAWDFDAPEYKAILGTELGKGVAAIVLSAFPRGTHRITRIFVWKRSIMQIRFDIEDKAWRQA